MRTQEQIKARIDELKAEKDLCQKWVNAANTRYESERRTWGKDADRGEMETANDQMRDLVTMITTLEWCLQSQLEPIS